MLVGGGGGWEGGLGGWIGALVRRGRGAWGEPASPPSALPCPTPLKAMKVLRTRIFAAERSRRDAVLTSNRRAAIGSGERNERIRTYNFPQVRAQVGARVLVWAVGWAGILHGSTWVCMGVGVGGSF